MNTKIRMLLTKCEIVFILVTVKINKVGVPLKFEWQGWSIINVPIERKPK